MKYEKCLSCKQLGSDCDGPNFLAMETAELGRWLNDKRKQIPGLTYDKIAAETGISKSAVYAFLTGAHADYRIETIRPIVKIIVGGKWDDNPCGNLSTSEKVYYENEIQKRENGIQWRDETIQTLRSENAELRSIIEDDRKQIQENRAGIKKETRIISLLSVSLVVILMAIIAVLLFDKFNPQIGFFR